MSTGWVKLHRSIQNSDTFSCLTLIQQIVAIYIILNANHKDGVWHDKRKGETIKVKRGQLITSRNKMYTEWFKKDPDISEQKIRTTLDRLEKMEFLTKQSTSTYTLITVRNYNVYQTSENDHQPSNQPALNQHLTTNKNVKNVKELKNNTSNKNSMDEDFEKLWKLYPKKTLKKDGLAAYKKAIKNGTTNKEIQNGIVEYKKILAANEWQKPMDGGRWFQKRRWEDEISCLTTNSSPRYKTLKEAMEEDE